jgi:hypothetical protein
MDSVKWLVRIVLLDREFDGHFQVNDYQHMPDPSAAAPARSLGPVRVSSLIARPHEGAELPRGETTRVVGYAWSGRGAVQRVEVSPDGAAAWEPARLVGPEAPHAWRLWEYDWCPRDAGPYRLTVRATDASGETQPEHAEWNVKGYGNNGLYQITVTVR